MNFLDGFKEHSYALLRIISGYLFLWHGTQKFLNFPVPGPGELNALMTLGGGIEIVGGLLILIGLFTRVAAFICSGTMAVAYWVFHAPHGNPIFPMVNNGELAVMYTFVFLYIAARGPGIWSVDSARS
ncbi:MAG: DoxX family membrane protein [Gammaproteobacteria bacterium]|nr:DoxX family membrane protein [Gammaproteobacteria bacterium]NKB64991.1 DoxX family membrane protein [Gammaproteobacteria bacterium]